MATIGNSLKLYTVYDNYNAVWPNALKADNTSDESRVPDVPVHFVAMAVINNRFYGGILGTTPEMGNTYTVNMTVTTPSAFKALVSKL
jgi:hypothetical protein